ncbi:peptidylprolyl isomerase [Hyphomonas sp.]|uniref:peptidylprolyl isomerase n=1 Tax=Hyphomonas sp. TaxID=87 RepID=UPI000C4D5560|nr:peptidylprolyl isomerase [Hyphomonas sp.]MAB09556.1 peptidylprolyl isomerase [Hyphomonas sp.]MAU66341.1 peptidylprolyl isomerase [Hyphomonas sp.]
MLKRLIPVFALIAACQSAPAETVPEPAAAPEDSAWRPVDPENLILFDLGQNGAIYIELLPEAAPANTAALREAVRTGYFDGEYFYRVIETHVAQAGREFDERLKDVPRLPLEAERETSTAGFDPLGSGDLYAAQVGHRKGFPVAHQRGGEWLLNCPGAIGMARDEGPDTAVTEIYIPLLPRRYLDRNYTIVGRVISGMDTVNRLARAEPATPEETAILFGDDPVAAADAASARADKLASNRIIAAHVAADMPQENRPAFEVMKTPSPDWDALKESKRDYSSISAFVSTPPKVLDICTLPVPARPIFEQ